MVYQTNDSKRDNLYSKPSGNPYASLSSHDENDVIFRVEPTDAQKRAYIKDLQDPYAYISIFGDLESEELTEEWLLEILSSYLPKSTQSRDRKDVNDIASEFVTLAKVLTLKQRSFVKSRLISMRPEGERKLEAARTTPASIKMVLLNLLDEAKKQK